jgi:branched-chain amino acid transport system permease protein
MKWIVGNKAFLVALTAFFAVLPVAANPYSLYIANLAMIYVVLAVGLNLLVGYAGQLAFANAAMMGIGAYAAGLLQVRLGVPYWLALPAGGLSAMLIGTTMAFPALRLSGIYLALATLAFAQATQWVFLNWEDVTFGATGFRVPRVDFAPLPLSSAYGIYYVSWALMIVLVVIAWNLVRSRIGRALVGMRDNEIAAEALGVDLLRYKVLAFALSGFYAGTAGALFCGVLNYVAPEGFDLFQMVIQKAMVVVGGTGSVVGSVLGAVLLIWLLEALREFKSLQEIAFGVVLLVFVLFMPEGIVSFLRRLLPGWKEEVHLAARGAAQPPPIADAPEPEASR